MTKRECFTPTPDGRKQLEALQNAAPIGRRDLEAGHYDPSLYKTVLRLSPRSA